jgi:hypothetical protein
MTHQRRSKRVVKLKKISVGTIFAQAAETAVDAGFTTAQLWRQL